MCQRDAQKEGTQAIICHYRINLEVMVRSVKMQTLLERTKKVHCRVLRAYPWNSSSSPDRASLYAFVHFRSDGHSKKTQTDIAQVVIVQVIILHPIPSVSSSPLWRKDAWSITYSSLRPGWFYLSVSDGLLLCWEDAWLIV